MTTGHQKHICTLVHALNKKRHKKKKIRRKEKRIMCLRKDHKEGGHQNKLSKWKSLSVTASGAVRRKRKIFYPVRQITFSSTNLCFVSLLNAECPRVLSFRVKRVKFPIIQNSPQTSR